MLGGVTVEGLNEGGGVPPCADVVVVTGGVDVVVVAGVDADTGAVFILAMNALSAFHIVASTGLDAADPAVVAFGRGLVAVVLVVVVMGVVAVVTGVVVVVVIVVVVGAFTGAGVAVVPEGNNVRVTDASVGCMGGDVARLILRD